MKRVHRQLSFHVLRLERSVRFNNGIKVDLKLEISFISVLFYV